MIDITQDAAGQAVALALAAARTGRPVILRDGLAEIAAALARRPEPVRGIAAHLVDATRAALGDAGIEA